MMVDGRLQATVATPVTVATTRAASKLQSPQAVPKRLKATPTAMATEKALPAPTTKRPKKIAVFTKRTSVSADDEQASRKTRALSAPPVTSKKRKKRKKATPVAQVRGWVSGSGRVYWRGSGGANKFLCLSLPARTRSQSTTQTRERPPLSRAMNRYRAAGLE